MDMLTDAESVTLNDILGTGTWNQQRTTEQLRGFITRREEEIDVEGFDDFDI